ncbi:MAG TPA: CHAT domain-containing protein [Kofleriaceae bacterium]|nr:CHAT domain-containing protein [Kofleriaceae bacterium]
MTERCEDLDLFFDRELEPDAEQAFRDHLATCTRCQDVLLGRMLEAAVVGEDRDSRPSIDPIPIAGMDGRDGTAPPSERPAEPPAEPPESPDHPTRLDRRRALFVAATILPAAAVAVLLLWPPGARQAPSAVAIELAPRRFVDVRFTAPELDRYREPSILRAASAAPVDRMERTEQISWHAVSELEQRGRNDAVVAALALNGDVASAERTAGKLRDAAARDSDRAALELLRVTSATEDRPAPASGAQLAAIQRALSLAADALRRKPDLSQAAWNRAVALSLLGLPLAAAGAFDEIAARNEPGWAREAAATAARLRSDHQKAVDDWQRVKDQADRMAAGGPVLGDDAVARAPSQARDAFYLALATAATTERIDGLAPLASKLDAVFATTTLGALVAQVRASDLRQRAPFAAELRGFLEQHRRPSTLNDLRARALERGVRDIVLASLLAVGEDAIDDADLALFDRLLDLQLLHGQLDDWWRIIALARRAYFMEFWRRDYPAVDAVERRAEPICKALHSGWCSRITLLAGGAHSQMGRADLAIEQLTAALRQARLARVPADEVSALDQLGEAIGIRVAEDIDSAVVGGAYLTEVALRKTTCRPRLQRLYFATLWALQHHRFDEAAGYRRDADALEQEECPDTSPRVNGETARLRLLLSGRGDLAAFRRAVAQLESGNHEERRLYRAFLDAAATLVEDRPRGEAALRQVIAAASADPTVPYAPLVRTSAYDALIEVSGDGKAVLDLLSERMAAPRFDRCALGIAQWNRLVVAALDGRGQPALEVREVPEGMMMIPPAEAVSPAIRARLADCPRVDVVAAAPYLGAPRLLDDRVAWVYHAAAPRPSVGHAIAHEVVVSEVAPPDDLHLPALRPYSGSPGAEVLSGARATPAAVLAAMRTASLAVVVAHGVTDAAEPTAASLILSPDPQGDYLLTASKVRAATLVGSPVVVLAGCDAGRVQVSAEPWSLATSFLHAGARVVIAPTAPIPDDTANDVFRSLIDRIRTGADPADALVTERTARQAAAPWLSSIVIFE